MSETSEGVKAQNYNNAMAHFYRGELQRTYNWRKRLDRTTNWAIIIMAAMLTWTFSTPAHLHFVLLIGLAFVLFLALIESRRYRMYVVWKSRVRVLEENFLAPLLCPEKDENEKDWCDILAEDLKKPTYKIGYFEAFARRLRRIYDWLFMILVGSWFSKLTIHPNIASSFQEIVKRAGIGVIEGGIVMATVLIFLGTMFGLSIYRWDKKYGVGEREAKGEIRPEDEKKEDWRKI